MGVDIRQETFALVDRLYISFFFRHLDAFVHVCTDVWIGFEVSFDQDVYKRQRIVDDGCRFLVGTESTDYFAGYLPCPCQSDQMWFWLVLRALFLCRSFLYVRAVDWNTYSGLGSCFDHSYLYLFMVIYLSGE